MPPQIGFVVSVSGDECEVEWLTEDELPTALDISRLTPKERELAVPTAVVIVDGGEVRFVQDGNVSEEEAAHGRWVAAQLEKLYGGTQ